MLGFRAKKHVKRRLKGAARLILCSRLVPKEENRDQEAEFADLSTETRILQLFVLLMVTSMQMTGRYRWANDQFFAEAVGEAIDEHCDDLGLPSGVLKTHFSQRVVQLAEFSAEEVHNNAHLRWLAAVAKDLDSLSASEYAITQRLEEAEARATQFAHEVWDKA